MCHISYIPASILVCTALILIKKLQHHIEMWKKLLFHIYAQWIVTITLIIQFRLYW